MSFVNVRDFAPADGNWTPAFTAAIQQAVDGGHAGVLVPASAAPYTVEAPPPGRTASIEFRSVRRLVLMGEGPRSIIAMTGPGSWRMVHVGDGAADIVVRDLCLDGSGATTADQQSHLLAIGASSRRLPNGTLPPRGARRISVLDCILRDAPADAVAIVPLSSTTSADEVCDITIARCHFENNGRSGVSNQRLARRVSILDNRFIGTSDQDIDFEPTGDLPDSGPSGYLITGNTMVRQGLGVSVTLSGSSPEAPSRTNTFAYNKIFGGALGVHDAHDLAIVGNHIAIGPKQSGTVVRLGGSLERVLFADNTVLRPRDTATGTLLNVSSEATTYSLTPADVDPASDAFIRQGHRLQTGVGPMRATAQVSSSLPTPLEAGTDYWAIRDDSGRFRLATSPQDAEARQAIDLQDAGAGTFVLVRHGFPRTVNVSRNRLTTFRPLPSGEALITVTNATAVSFRDNDVESYADTVLPTALKLEAKDGVRMRAPSVWDVVGNRFRGDAETPDDVDAQGAGTFTTGVSLASGRNVVAAVRVADNTFAGCGTQVRVQSGPGGGFDPTPLVSGNLGDGTPLA